MSTLRPCGYCEEELPETAFDSPHAPFCKTCSHQLAEIARRKYGVVAAAYFRAQLRHQTKHLAERIKSDLPT